MPLKWWLWFWKYHVTSPISSPSVGTNLKTAAICSASTMLRVNGMRAVLSGTKLIKCLVIFPVNDPAFVHKTARKIFFPVLTARLQKSERHLVQKSVPDILNNNTKMSSWPFRESCKWVGSEEPLSLLNELRDWHEQRHTPDSLTNGKSTSRLINTIESWLAKQWI